MPRSTYSISSYSRAKQTEKRMRETILDVLAYFAMYQRPLSTDEILNYLPVKANMVGLKNHLAKLQKRGKILQQKDGRYGLKSHKYLPDETFTANIDLLSAEVKKQCKFIAQLPFIYAIAISTDTYLSHKPTSPQLIFLCAPERLYLVKSLVEYFTKKKQSTLDAAAYPLYYTNKALRFRENMGHNELSRTLWFALARPVYGSESWQAMLQKTPSIASRLPNMQWGYYNQKLGQGTSRLLDKYDNTTYKNTLREMATKADYQAETSLLRVRPDCFLALLAHREKLESQSAQYGKIRAKF